MSITSLSFIIFLCLIIVGYYLVPGRYQWIVLLISNIVFYLLGGVQYIVYLLVTILTTWYGAKRIGYLNDIGHLIEEYADVKCIEKGKKKILKSELLREKKYILILVLLINFGILGILKYFRIVFTGLITVYFPQYCEILMSDQISLLPLGISFYTFQSMGYLIDIFREKYPPERSLWKYALFASFFPQMVQGPIGRFEELAPQLYAEHRFDYEKLKFGVQLMLWGFFKKLVIADRISIFTDTIFVESDTYSGILILTGILLYTIQLYMDFSGGIDIVTGAAETLGISLALNFERPYFAKSVPEFWRRWHMTLGAWFRDYVFYPLSLSKLFNKLGKRGRKIFGNYIGKLIPIIIPQFIVFFLIGIWHGANWKYCVFGFYHGVLIVGTILLEEPMTRLWNKIHINTNCFVWKCLQVLYTFILVMFGRVITMAPNLSYCQKMISSIFTNFQYNLIKNGDIFGLGIDRKNFIVLGVALLVVFSASILQEKGIIIRQALKGMPLIIRWSACFFMLFAILIFGIYGIGYNASDFVYRGF